MSYFKKIFPFNLMLILFISGCSSSNKVSSSADEGNKGNQDVKTVTIAFANNEAPQNYEDKNGNPAGYEIEVMKLVDKELPQYKFKYVATTDDDLLIGVQTGKYQAGTKGAFYTEERAKKYIYPKEFFGGSVTGLVVRAEDKDRIKNLADLAKTNAKLIPIAPQNAQYNVITDYNKEHPDDPIKLENSENFTVLDWAAWLMEKRYDAFMAIKTAFEKSVKEQGAPYKNLDGKLVFNQFTAIKTYPLFNNKEQQLADDFDSVIKRLKEDGTLNKLAVQYLGEDTIKLVE
ncbi:transporter substrate-binding domain-containing protein [Ectobacillus funiculus]|uniref:Transporter substrate-binding domain-containing protein n=1 Tax=Ectobacillus funiculus TaxID=137993 RepID=A0ABV5WIP8_9BACI